MSIYRVNSRPPSNRRTLTLNDNEGLSGGGLLGEPNFSLIIIDPISNDGLQKSQTKFIFSWKAPIFDNPTPQKEPQFHSRRNKVRRSYFASNTLSQRAIQLLEQFLIAGKPLILRQFGAPTQKPETFQNRGAILHRGIKRTHSGFVPLIMTRRSALARL